MTSILDPVLWDAPLVIAHRGSRLMWPENTIHAFSAAIELGVDHIETDIRLSSDGVVHCLHDATLGRTTDGVGSVGSRTAAEVALLDAGFRHSGPDGFSFRGLGLTIPTFEELALTFPEIRIVVDVKEDAVVEPFVSLVRRLGVAERLIVGSFNDQRVARFRELTDGEVPTSTGAALTRSWLLASRLGRGGGGAASALQVPRQMRGVRVVDQRLVDAAHERGLQVHVWTVNAPHEMDELFAMGVDGLITDRPDLALSRLPVS